MLRNVLALAGLLAFALNFAQAESLKGKITKIDDKKVTIVTGRKGETETKELDIAKDCKFNKMEGKKSKVDLADGLKNEAFRDLGKRGVAATVTVAEGKVTEVTVAAKKKKTAE